MGLGGAGGERALQILTAPVAVIVDAVSYLWSALMLSRIRTVETPAAAHGGTGVIDDIVAGFRACLVLHQLVGDAFLTAFLIHALSLRQRVIPAAVLARANTTFQVTTGSMPPGGLMAVLPLLGRPVLRLRQRQSA